MATAGVLDQWKKKRIYADPMAVNLNVEPPYWTAIGETVASALIGGGLAFAFALTVNDGKPEGLLVSASTGTAAAMLLFTGELLWWNREIDRWINENFEIRRLAANARFTPQYQDFEIEDTSEPAPGYLPIKRTRTVRRAYRSESPVVTTAYAEEQDGSVALVDVNLLMWRFSHYPGWDGDEADLSERTWTPQPFSIPEWRTMRGFLISRNDARWKGRNHKSGWEITKRTRAIMRGLAAKATPPLSLMVKVAEND